MSIELSSESVSSFSLEIILENLAAIARQIQQGWELEHILQAAIANARTSLQADRVLIYRFLPDQDAVVAVESVGREWTPLLGQLIYDPCFDAIWMKRYQQGQSTTIADAHDGTIDPCYVQLLDRLQVQANLVVPIFHQDNLWGLLITHHCRSPHQWQPLEMQCVQHVALHLGIAIQQAELRQCQQQLEDQLQQHKTGISEINLEKELLLSKTLFNTSIDGIVILNHQGNVVEASPSFAQMLGYTVEETLELNVADWDAQWSRADLQQMLQGAFPVPPCFETRHRRRDGSLYDVEISYSRVEFDGEQMHFCICRDISDRKAAEAALRESETRWQFAIEGAEHGVWDWNVQTNMVFHSRQWSMMLGYAEDELGTGLEEWDSRVHPDDKAQIYADINQHFSGQIPLYQGEYRLRCKNGSYKWILDRGKVMEWTTEGNPLRMIGIVTDISDRKQMEEALRESQEKYKTLFQILPIGISITDAQGQLLEANAASEKILGLTIHDHTTRRYDAPDWHMIRSDGSPMPPAEFASVRALQENRFIYDMEMGMVHADGDTHWMSVSAAPIPLEHYGVAICYVDITDRKQTDLRLLLQSAALDACADIVMITDCQGMIAWVNPAFTQITGYSLEETIGRNPRDLVKSGHQGHAFYQDLWTTILAGQTWRSEMVNRRKDGSLYTEKITITPVRVRHNEISHFIAIKQDITDQKQIEQAERQRLERERVINQISHLIRQSLDLDQILNTAVAEVKQFLHTDRVIIYRLNPDWTGVVVAESVAPEWLSLLNLEITDSYFVETQGADYHDKHIKMVSDIYTVGFSPCHVDMLERLQVRAKLVVPIFHGDQTWGLLIAHHCRSPREWQPFEGELMVQLVTPMAIAIHQAELHQRVQTLNTSLELEVQDRTAQLQQALEFEALLKRVTDRVRDSLDEEQILQQVVQELVEVLQVDCCDTTSYSADRTTTTVNCECTPEGYTAKHATSTIADSSDPNLYVQLLQGHYCHFCLIEQNVLRPDQPQKTILACPIMDEQGVLGDLWLFKSSQTAFNDQEVRLVQQVANQCAIALRQSRLYQAAQQQVQELERLNQLKDDFLSTVSHELRTPMASIKMATQMLEIKLKPLGVLDDESNAIHRYFNVLRDEGQRELSLINDLLDLARLDAEREPLTLTAINLQFYIPHVAEPFIERAQQQQQQLTMQIPDNLPSVTTDLPYLERILTELLHNACKYTPAGETIAVSAQSTGDVMEIRVSNTGVEIPAVEYDLLFEKFYRIPNNDPWKHGGTGLGLALVRKLIERLGGQIHVESGGGQTTFILTLYHD